MNDTLSEKDCELFYKLKNLLYMFVNRKVKALPEMSNWKDVGNHPPEKIIKIRDFIFNKNLNEIDNFVKENPYHLNEDELNIVSSWKKAIVAEKFILFKYEKEHTLFFGNKNVYAVKGLMDSFRQFFDSHTPIFINLIILPFKNVLVHEGLFVPYNVMIGSRMGRSLKAEAEEMIMKKGITSSLNDEREKEATSEENMLRFYMKSEANRDRFFEEINDLREKSSELEAVYNNEVGRINSKQIKSQLKKQGIKGHFAVLFSQVVASGQTRQELSKNISIMLPEEKQDQVYTFQIR